MIFSRRVVVTTLATIACAVVAIILVPNAFPVIALDIRLTRAGAEQRARDFAAQYGLAPPGARAAARFEADDRLQTFIELAGGGKDTLAAVVRGGDIALFTWHVRLFEPGVARELTVVFGADGQLVGVERKLAEADVRPTIAKEIARARADSTIARWGDRDPARFRFVSSSVVRQPTSGRVDRTFTYEHTERSLGGAPVRLEVRIAGDLPTGVRQYVDIPDAFERRYEEMRSANDLLALLAQLAVPLFGIAGLVALARLARRGLVRWRPAGALGVTLGVLVALTALNDVPSAWFDYDTATSPTTFLLRLAFEALASGAVTALAATVLVAMAEALTRIAFPDHVDWWAYWRHRGTREVAGRVLGGYALAVLAFACVAAFYTLSRRVLGWWVPSGILDDPNQIATAFPWLAALALSLLAGILEECLFRAVPLSLLAILTRNHPRRQGILAGGVVLTALVFGFAHANYPSWPPYSRGAELFLESVLWAVVFLRYGLPTTIVAHFVFDLVLFSLFALSGSAPEYRITAAVVITAMLLPAVLVAVRWARQRQLVALGPDARFVAWRPGERREVVREAMTMYAPLSAGTRAAAAAAIAVALVVVVLAESAPTLGPPFTVGRDGAVAIADSVLRFRGVRLAGWTALPATQSYDGDVRDAFLERHASRELQARLARTYEPAAAWVVRYVRTRGTVHERAEEWRVRLLPDGSLLDVRHTVPEGASGDSPTADAARVVAVRALRDAGLQPATLREVELEIEPRPARRDVTIEYADGDVTLPRGAEARVRVRLAGSQPLAVERYIRLPEDVMRADRARRENRGAASEAAALVLALAVLAGTLLIVVPAVRARAQRHPIGHPGTLRAAPSIAFTAAWQVLLVVNARPSALAAWETATPWSTHLAILAVGTVMATLGGVVIVALWGVADEARVRLGIPFWPVDPSPPRAARDALIAGSALGLALLVGLSGLSTLAARREPVAPGTAMDTSFPALADVLHTVEMALIGPPLLGLVAAIIVVVGRNRAGRALALVALATLVAPITADVETSYWREWALLVGGLTIAALAIHAWGRQSGLAWVLAVVVASLAGSAVDAVRAAAAPDRTSAVLGALAALAIIATLLARAVATGARELSSPDTAAGPSPPEPAISGRTR